MPGLDSPRVQLAEPYQPSDVQTGSLPLFINELNAARNPADIPISAGQQYRQTVITMMLCVARREEGLDLKYSVEKTAQWSDAVFTAFSQHVRLSSPALPIISSTNAGPISIKTAVQHGYATGDAITIAGHLVNTNANGPWIVTVVDDWNFTLDGSNGNGVGGFSGTARKTQPLDLGNVVDAVIVEWSPAVNYPYGSTELLALAFALRVREMYVTSIAA